MQVSHVSAKYVLDFVFYHDGRRRVPSSVTLGDFVFKQPVGSPEEAPPTGAVAGAPTAAVSPPVESRNEQRPPMVQVRPDLSQADSGDDSDDSLSGAVDSSVASKARGAAKRARENDLMEFGLRARARPRQIARIDGAAELNCQQVLDAGPTEPAGKGQFRASRLQNTVHQAIVNGTYAYMHSQLFVEHLQAQIELLAFLPHPAVLKGFYAWEFGTRGLSILHFGRLDVTSRRQRLRESICATSLAATAFLSQHQRRDGTISLRR
jgi:hypothetical protein